MIYVKLNNCSMKVIFRYMKKIIKKLLPVKLANCYATLKNHYSDDHHSGGCYSDAYSIKSYSLEGEDMILRIIFGTKKTGFYVDVGAHHPFRLSNTYYFYKLGWHGINIDAMPGSMELFGRFRNRDINLEVPVSSTEQVLTYFSFSEPAFNSFSEELVRERVENGSIIEQKIELKTSKLSSLLDQYLPKGTEIDFLCIDVEGLDLDVLHSNNWDIYRPRVVIAEELRSVSGEKDNSIRDFLASVGYHELARTCISVFYVPIE